MNNPTSPNHLLSRLLIPISLAVMAVVWLAWGLNQRTGVQASGPERPVGSSALLGNGDPVTVTMGSPVQIAFVTWFDWPDIQDHFDAVQMALDDYGSIKGFSLQQNLYDGGCDGPSGESAATAVISNTQNLGVVGPFCSSSTMGALPVLETANVVMISSTSTATDIHTNGPTVFNRVVVEDPLFDKWNELVSTLSSVASWEAEFATIYGQTPETLAKYTYDATILLLTHIDAVSVLDGSGNLIVDRAVLAQAVRGTTGMPGVTGSISLDPVEGNRIYEWVDIFLPIVIR